MIVIADSGSTSTDWRIYDGKDTISISGIGINPFHTTEGQIIEDLGSGELSGYSKEVRQIFFYGAGLANESAKTIMRNAFKRVFENADGIYLDQVGSTPRECYNGNHNHLNPWAMNYRILLTEIRQELKD